MQNNPYFIGALAGVASALMLLSANVAGALAVLLYLASPIPIYIAVLGWGTHAGVAASVVAIGVLGVTLSPLAALATGAMLTLPALLMGHQANLAQPSQHDPNMLDWFPLDQLLFNMATVLAIGIIASGAALGFPIEALIPRFMEVLKEVGSQYPQISEASDEQLRAIAQSALTLVPATFAAHIMVIHIINMHLAVNIVRASGRMPRPADNIPMQASLPRMALIAMPVTTVLAYFTTGGISLIFSTFAGAYIMAFCLVGMAALHARARQSGNALALLIICYLLVILFFPILLAFAVAGLIRVASRNAQAANQTHPNE